MDTTSQPIVDSKNSVQHGCLSEIGWLFASTVLPICSLSFYRRASQRRVGQALLFFFLITIFISILNTIALGITLNGISQDIRDAYQSGQFPEISISNGVADVDGPQPIILVNEQTSTGAILVAVDTSGQITSIDESRYDQGFLLTRTELHMMSANGRAQIIPLHEFNNIFQKDPLILNGETLSHAWVTISVFVDLVYFILLLLWNSVARLMFIAVIALIVWGVASLFSPKISFNPFIIGGLYAIVPAIYLTHLLNLIGVRFPGLQTLFLLLFWTLALVASLVQEKIFSVEVPPRLWMVLIGVPMLILFMVDLFVTTPSTYWQIALWSVFLTTLLVLCGLRLYFHIRAMRNDAPSQITGSSPI